MEGRGNRLRIPLNWMIEGWRPGNRESRRQRQAKTCVHLILDLYNHSLICSMLFNSASSVSFTCKSKNRTRDTGSYEYAH